MNSLISELTNRLQKFFVLTLLLVSAAHRLNAKAGDTFVIDNLCYTVLTETDKGGTVSVGSASDAVSGTLNIPPVVINKGISYQVTAIADEGFFKCGNLTGHLVTA